MAHLRPFVFFDLGQTLIDESAFIGYFDTKFLEILNGFGAKIDGPNYKAVRDSIIRDRKIGYGSVMELAVQVCKVLLPPGYETGVAQRVGSEIAKGRSLHFKFFDDAPRTMQSLADMQIEMGLIANQSIDILKLLDESGLQKYFKVRAISSLIGVSKPDPKAFQYAISQTGRPPEECIMVGDRLDTDICPANTLGMTTIRYLNSLFSLQQPRQECEYATYSVSKLGEIPAILERIISR